MDKFWVHFNSFMSLTASTSTKKLRKHFILKWTSRVHRNCMSIKDQKEIVKSPPNLEFGKQKCWRAVS